MVASAPTGPVDRTGLKIRIGVGLGAGVDLDRPGRFGSIVERLEALGFDSLWVSERVASPTLDPLVAMSYAVARTERLKVGPSVMVLPGRNPVVLAKALASLDRLSGGRVLPAFGLGVANAVEHQAFGVDRRDRAPWFDEALPLMRRLWTGDEVTHHGERFHLDGARIGPTPVSDPFDVWLGGAAASELRRCGRLGDGWLPSFTTPAAVEAGIELVEAAATEHGRSVDPQHYGVLIPYVEGPLPEAVGRLVATRQPDADPAEIVADSVERVARLVDEFVAVGASKFVVFPLGDPPDWDALLGRFADGLLPLET
jgi:probable F420-dependent oxidoreductase